MQVFVPCKVYSLNEESGKGTWHWRAAIRKKIRGDAKIAALAAVRADELVSFGEQRVQIIVEPHECRTRLTDAGNCVTSAKAAIDGLKDAGVLVDDGPRYVAAVTFLVGRRVGIAYEGLRIMFREWEG